MTESAGAETFRSQIHFGSYLSDASADIREQRAEGLHADIRRARRRDFESEIGQSAGKGGRSAVVWPTMSSAMHSRSGRGT